ncbi:MAG: metal-dependent phosphohydrolase [Opitutae bacterium]|nr:metal-dependent phosphohydrolase [Opitutae bacterium]|tara:strand:- start:8779 stop:9636 length:858 start_codon:yes stop_codon:yes gene_type:complete
MLNLQTLKIDPFAEHLASGYESTFGTLYPEKVDFLRLATHHALENIANGDMLYHNVDHTIMVTMVGLEIIRGKHLQEGHVDPDDGLNYLLALLCHDIGYVKGACLKDQSDQVDDGNGGMLEVSRAGTCALLTPVHVDRSKQFVRECFDHSDFVNLDLVAECIERTRFPVPEGDEYQGTADLPGLTRAADLVGQLGDPEYLRKIPALFYEFEELGRNSDIGCDSPGDLRRGYAQFFWEVAHRYVEDAVELLRLTQEGKEWVSRLHSHVFECEHFLGQTTGESGPIA